MFYYMIIFSFLFDDDVMGFFFFCVFILWRFAMVILYDLFATTVLFTDGGFYDSF